MKSNWQIKKLDEVARIHGGGTPPTTEPKYFRGEINWFTPTEIPKNEVSYINESQRKISESAKQFTTISGINTVLLTSRATIGTVAILSTPSGYNQGIKGIEPKPELDSFYLAHWLASNKDEIISKASGTTFKEISTSEVKKLEIPLPPLQEQKRIVNRINKTIEEIKRIKENAEKNLQNSRELFESYLQSVFEINTNKQIKMFGEVIELIGGSQPPKDNFIYEPKDGYIRLIQVRDYRTDKYKTYIPKDKAKRFCSRTDIMIGRYGPPIFGIFRGLEGAYNVALMKAVPNTKLCTSEYIYWFLNTRKLHLFVERSSKRAVGQDGIKRGLLYKYPIPIPTLSEQKIIVSKLINIQSEAKKLEAVYQQKAIYLEEFKKSVLQKAFSGEL